MPIPRYENVAPLLDRADYEKPFLHCVFRCPVTRRSVPSSVNVELANRSFLAHEEGTPGSLPRNVRRNVFGRLRSLLHPIQALQSNRVQKQTADGATAESARRNAIVFAFSRVFEHFCWDRELGGWKHESAGCGEKSDFELQLGKAPLRSPSDRHLLARLLVHVAHVDGALDAEEHAFLHDFVPSDCGDLEALEAAGPPTDAECAGIEPGGDRVTILMLCWAAALCDYQLRTGEDERLAQIAGQLGLDEEEARRAERLGRGFVLDLLFSALHERRGNPDPEAERDALERAASTGIPLAEAEAALRSFRQRQGLL